jgi:hypothetical protein
MCTLPRKRAASQLRRGRPARVDQNVAATGAVATSEGGRFARMVLD